MRHKVRVIRRTSGWARWVASCTCGWGVNRGGRGDVEQAATDHAHANRGSVEMGAGS